MDQLPFKRAADVEGEFRIPARVSKLLLAPKFGGVENVSMGMNITEVGSKIPDHVHHDSLRQPAGLAFCTQAHHSVAWSKSTQPGETRNY